MLPTTPLPTPVRADTSEHVEFEYSAGQIYRDAKYESAASWGNRTLGFGATTANPPIEESIPGSAMSSTTFIDKLFSAWAEKISHILESGGTNARQDIIKVCERYLLALKSSTDHRIFISSLMNSFKFNGQVEPGELTAILRSLGKYAVGELTKDRTVAFVRELRSIGLSPSSLGKIDV